MKREFLMPGVALTEIPADVFKRCRISLNFILKGERSTATACALLPLVMERGYSRCPDMTRLSRRLALLYGAELTVSGATLGPNRVITVGVSGLKNEYAVNGEDLLGQYLELLFGMAFEPDVKDGAFSPEAVAIERDKLRELQESEINDKRLYCLRQARRRFYGDDVGGLEKYGYPAETAAVTPQQLYDAWKKMVSEAAIECVVLGAPAEAVAARLRSVLQNAGRRPAVLNAPHVMPLRPALFCSEPVDAAQGKLCLMYTQARALQPEELSQMRMAVALLGGTPTSRLFMNVREKQSLCYYCSASYTQLGGCLCIDSGIDTANAVRTRQAIQHEIDALMEGPIPEKELEDARRYLVCALDGVGDSLAGLENWALGEISRGTQDTPQQVARQLMKVDAGDVRAMLRLFSLSVVYTLEGGEQA